MAKLSKDEKYAKRQSRKAAKQAEKERRQDRNDARRASRKELKFSHSARKARTDRVTIRQENRTERVASRQHAKEVKFEQKSESDQAAYNNGMDPNKWKADLGIAGIGAVDHLGSTAMEVFGGRGGRRDRNQTDAEKSADELFNDTVTGKRKPPIGLIIGIVIGVLALIGSMALIFKRKKR